MTTKADWCCVVDSISCEAPPGEGGTKTRGKCFACGEGVCRSCSVITTYLRYGRRRVCHNCLPIHLGERGRWLALDHVYRLAGYSGAPRAEDARP